MCFAYVCCECLQAGAPANPEAELQRQLARKLGLKKGKTKMGGEDGLDEFLEGERLLCGSKGKMLHSFLMLYVLLMNLPSQGLTRLPAALPFNCLLRCC